MKTLKENINVNIKTLQNFIKTAKNNKIARVIRKRDKKDEPKDFGKPQEDNNNGM